ncbi:hypothetical protein T07_2638 [Trichinella nelsoni]|uniref:Uncharacterized protein n=1 Tax=Trichinella nelsoni TaxID=6336 RepID=A0A0V0S9M1_9BILA|nr:hypothetical protein T07_2638 [Trichinella nelsoni]
MRLLHSDYEPLQVDSRSQQGLAGCLRTKKSGLWFFSSTVVIHLQSLTARPPDPDGRACPMNNLIICERAVLAHRSAISEPNDRKFSPHRSC